ncbi:3-deoxy-manno-octulosonate cytidylyltransferase isoform X2 [Brachypodium distachyon]|uniref:3-deoxy-manno-octulosonate cytidylyltransferase isoform X2 n=1 Tax=Brachypodium distachyon TaxID=15368 RepID=UPI0001C71F2A|nr:3-deoxy-manno-octulosonate cytidylyltransferase isoform X2 [Brachypodium distachyon]|eukprot:XP_010231033.1 3-deoxy-manno-octulosonate cytidylyltransferase isoform X2 [Brachypodium distachyon]
MTICAPASESSGSGSRAWVLHGLALGAAAAAAYLYRRPRGFRTLAVGIIPARYASSRFEGKPLALILGKPMIQRTWERVMLASSLDHVVVATDDEKIAECCRGFGADVIMTSVSCQNGSERCCEALQKLEKCYDIVVNIQGDEPLIEPEIIDGVVMALQRAPDAVFSTAVTALKPEDAFDTNRVKCVVDNQGYAIYFSRGLIPFNKSGKANPQFPYHLHLGISCFDSKFLKIYPQLAPTPLQLEEDLEQLKVLENGYRMKGLGCKHACVGATDRRRRLELLSVLASGETRSARLAGQEKTRTIGRQRARSHTEEVEKPQISFWPELWRHGTRTREDAAASGQSRERASKRSAGLAIGLNGPPNA